MTKTLGNRVKKLRLAVGLNQNALAEILDINIKSIQRYETNKSLPDTYSLVKLATYFDVSTDYLLGLTSYKEEIKEVANKIRKDGKYNEYYRHYIECKNNQPDETGEYYWINSYIKDGRKIIGGQTEWAGWADKKYTKERRRLRPVIAKNAIELCTRVHGKPLVLNEERDTHIFRLFGGEAIVKKEICEKYLPEFLKDFIVENPEKNLFRL